MPGWSERPDVVAPARSDGAVWQDLDLVRSALGMALEGHRHDLRKGTAVPYVSHLWSVAALVLEHGGDDVQAAAALLHDLAEDHGGRRQLDRIRSELGPGVADIVEWLSDSLVDTEAGEEKAPWHDRKSAALRHLVDAPARVLLVKACDQLHNARSVLADYRRQGAALWTVFTVSDPALQLWLHRSMLAMLRPQVPVSLGDEIARTVDALAVEIRREEPDIDARVAAVRLAPDPADT